MKNALYKLLKEFIVPIFFGTISLLPFFLIRVNKGWSGLLIILIISLIWSIIYLFTLILSKNITIHELKQYFVKKNNIETK